MTASVYMRSFRVGRLFAAFLHFHEQQAEDMRKRIIGAPDPVAFLNAPERWKAIGESFEPWLRERNWDEDVDEVRATLDSLASLEVALRILWLRILTRRPLPEAGLICVAAGSLARPLTKTRPPTPEELMRAAGQCVLPEADTERSRARANACERWRGRIRTLEREDHYLSARSIRATSRRLSRDPRARKLLELDTDLISFICASFVSWSRYKQLHRVKVTETTWVDGKRASRTKHQILMQEDHEQWSTRLRLTAPPGRRRRDPPW